MNKLLNKLPIISDFFMVFSENADLDGEYLVQKEVKDESVLNNYQKTYLEAIKNKLDEIGRSANRNTPFVTS